jgi:hypothetical protein
MGVLWIQIRMRIRMPWIRFCTRKLIHADQDLQHYGIFLFPEVFLLSFKSLDRICKMVSMWPSQMLSTCLIKKRSALIHPPLE